MFAKDLDNQEGIRTLQIRYRKSPIPKTICFIYLWFVFRSICKLMHEGWKPDITHEDVNINRILLSNIY